jgi:hypothetical protein
MPAKNQGGLVNTWQRHDKARKQIPSHRLRKDWDGGITLIAGISPHLRDGQQTAEARSPSSRAVLRQAFEEHGSTINESFPWGQK